MMVPGGRDGWVAKCRRAEELGYDVIGVADHLGMPPPFPSLVLAAEATRRVRLCPYVVNTSFHNAALLARDAAATDQFTGGRLELGLGTGYVKAEFDDAGLDFPGPGRRLDHLETTIAELRKRFADGEPAPARRQGPPLLLGGQRDRMLRIAAREGDIVGLTGVRFTADGGSASVATAAEMAERVEFVRAAAGERADELELNLLIQKVVVTGDRDAALDQLRPYTPGLTADEFAAVPILLVGTAAQIAEQLLAQRERFGFTYLTVLEADLETFAPVIALLRR